MEISGQLHTPYS